MGTVLESLDLHGLADDTLIIFTTEGCAAGLLAWMRETEDPLLHGDPAPPPGAEINDPDQLSPSEPLTVVS